MATNYTGNSIVDYLASIGQGNSYAERARLAAQYGMQNYQGSAQQNTQLLGMLRNANTGGEVVNEANEQAAIDQEYAEAVAENPVIQELTQGGSSVEEIIFALETGDLTGIVDWQGQPFSAEQQQEALTKANEANKLYYEALQAKEAADAEAQGRDYETR